MPHSLTLLNPPCQASLTECLPPGTYELVLQKENEWPEVNVTTQWGAELILTSSGLSSQGSEGPAPSVVPVVDGRG